ncbi:hypothetical protein EYF80_033189 [Liparis tanakae]|uniref:Uncharacterized protein n=1 Tax=Liparis tanakae TaxID=230148 RepID=A0A4Z2GV86_9TELE|nr:hypothetical protein EYF80_033189 [Liparis tanakae]
MWCINCASDKTPAILHNKLLYCAALVYESNTPHLSSTLQLAQQQLREEERRGEEREGIK